MRQSLPKFLSLPRNLPLVSIPVLSKDTSHRLCEKTYEEAIEKAGAGENAP
jgi:hypothetical protein